MDKSTSSKMNSVVMGGGLTVGSYPYWQQTYPQPAQGYHIRKVTNGYILNMPYSEEVYESLDSLFTGLRKHLEEEK